MDRVEEDKSEGEVSIAKNAAVVEQSEANQSMRYPKVKLNKYVPGNKSMQFLVNSSLVNVVEPVHFKTNVSEH